MSGTAKEQLKSNREQIIEAVEWIKKTPNGVVRFRPENKREEKEIKKLIEEIVEEEIREKIEVS